MTEHWDLSYYVGTIDWNGRIMHWDPSNTRPWRETPHTGGIPWVGVNGISLGEKFDCDVDRTAPLIGRWFKELDLRLSSYHFSAPTFATLADGQDVVRANLERNVELFAQWSPRAMVVHADWIYRSEERRVGK